MAYGFSIYPHYSSLDDPNPAAFHPTPVGQKAIATKVESVVAQLFKSSRQMSGLGTDPPRDQSSRRLPSLIFGSHLTTPHCGCSTPPVPPPVGSRPTCDC